MVIAHVGDGRRAGGDRAPCQHRNQEEQDQSHHAWNIRFDSRGSSSHSRLFVESGILSRMQEMQAAWAWVQGNPAMMALCAYMVAGAVNAVFKPRTPEQYAKLPKVVAGLLKMTSAMGLDPVKLVEALV